MGRNRIAVLTILAVLSAGGLVMRGSASTPPVALPESVSGWGTAADTVYTRESIYGYIDGGAELYLSYGFASLHSRTYAREGGPDIVVDLFDMAESKNAFGVFSHSRETIDDTFGQGSQHTRGLLVFWKDKYYVSVLASPETEESRAAVFELARRIEEAIPGTGALPAVLEFLPEDSLVEESVRYFHHHVWLNSHYYVADENILHIDDETDAVLAKYESRGRRALLLVVEYPGEAAALLARSDFIEHYLPEIDEDSVARIEDGTWAGCRVFGRVLAAVFNSPSREAAMSLMARVTERAGSSRTGDRGHEPR